MSIFLGKRIENDEEVRLGLKTFRRHFVCFGSSGSGKTVLCKVICEEFVRKKIPVIAIDPQGDLASMLVSGDPEEIAGHGVPQEVLTEFNENAEIVVWTPGSSKGIPLSLNPLMMQLEGLDQEDVVHSISMLASSLAGLLGYDLDKDDGRVAGGFFYIVFEYVNKKDLAFKDFNELARFITQAPEDLSKSFNEIISEKELKEIAKKLKLLTIGSKKLIFQLGVPLDIDVLLGRDGGEKTRISIIYLNTLQNQEEKLFFISTLVQKLYRWMLANPSGDVQALFYIDEISPYLPPVRKPPTKPALGLLFKQARKYGISCLVATQNPGDIDYTSLSQFGTWALGRLMTKQDIGKVEDIIKSIDPDKTDYIVKTLPQQNSGEFILISPDEFEDVIPFKSRWLVTGHKTLTESDLVKLIPGETRGKFIPPVAEVGEKEEPQIETENDLGTRIEDLLMARQECLSAKEISESFNVSREKISKDLKKIIEMGNIKKGLYGKENVYWHKDFKFIPELGLIRPIKIARLVKTEQEARKLVDNYLESGFLNKKESVENTGFIHYPLWQVPIMAQFKKGLLSREKIEKTKLMFIDAREGRLFVPMGKKGFGLVDVVDKNPFFIDGPEDICEFDTKFPGDVELDLKMIKKIFSPDEARRSLERKYGLETGEPNLVLFPLWDFEIKHREKKKSRHITLDGIFGRTIDMD